MVLVSSNLIIASVDSWIFLALASPLHLLLAAALNVQPEVREEGRDNRQYRNLKANEYLEEEEDVLVKIDKMLERN